MAMLDSSIARSSGISFAKHVRREIILDISNEIDSYFPKPTEHYNELDLNEFRSIVVECQDSLNAKNYTRLICENIKSHIIDYIDEEKFYIQTNLYLRAARPFTGHQNEVIDWHRETFYGANMERSINIWTPIKGVDCKNTLRFIPLSQEIDEDDIVTFQTEDPVTCRGSNGHKIGLLYAPKTIVSGVNLENSVAMLVPDFYSSIFPGLLIHGAAKNKSNKIRFSVDFRILPARYYKAELSKSFHFSSNKPYFEMF
jgi:hypothetical protein